MTCRRARDVMPLLLESWAIRSVRRRFDDPDLLLCKLLLVKIRRRKIGCSLTLPQRQTRDDQGFILP